MTLLRKAHLKGTIATTKFSPPSFCISCLKHLPSCCVVKNVLRHFFKILLPWSRMEVSISFFDLVVNVGNSSSHHYLMTFANFVAKKSDFVPRPWSCCERDCLPFSTQMFDRWLTTSAVIVHKIIYFLCCPDVILTCGRVTQTRDKKSSKALKSHPPNIRMPPPPGSRAPSPSPPPSFSLEPLGLP